MKDHTSLMLDGRRRAAHCLRGKEQTTRQGAGYNHMIKKKDRERKKKEKGRNFEGFNAVMDTIRCMGEGPRFVFQSRTLRCSRQICTHD